MPSYSITTNDRRCPPAQPVGIVNDDTGELVGCYSSTVLALRGKELLERGPVPVMAYSQPTFAW